MKSDLTDNGGHCWSNISPATTRQSWIEPTLGPTAVLMSQQMKELRHRKILGPSISVGFTKTISDVLAITLYYFLYLRHWLLEDDGLALGYKR